MHGVSLDREGRGMCQRRGSTWTLGPDPAPTGGPGQDLGDLVEAHGGRDQRPRVHVTGGVEVDGALEPA